MSGASTKRQRTSKVSTATASEPAQSANARTSEASTAAASDPAESVNAALDLSTFECPVCMELILGAIMQCQDGHIICEPCAEGLPKKVCPSCRQPYLGGKPGRNRMLEGVLATANLPCPNGCGLRTKCVAMQSHMLVCPGRKVLCPAHTCGCKIGLDKLMIHYQEKHPQAHGDIDREGVPGRRSLRHAYGPCSLEELDKFAGKPAMMVSGVCGHFVFKAHHFADTGLTSRHGHCQVLQLQVYHFTKAVSVQFSIYAGDEEVLRGPKAVSKLIQTDTKGLLKGLNVDFAEHQSKHMFLRKQIENAAEGRDISIRCSISMPEVADQRHSNTNTIEDMVLDVD